MNPQIVRIIDQYLTGKLSPEDKIVFEERLKSEPKLQRETNLQRHVMETAKRAAQRQWVKQAGKSYHFRKKMINSGIVVAIAAGLTFAVIAIVSKNSHNGTPANLGLMEKAVEEKLNSTLFFPNLAVERKVLNSADTVIFLSDGTMLSVPDNAFLLDGKEFHGEKIIQYQVARNASDIVKSGLSTMSDGKLLETGGMFSLDGYAPGGKKLQINPKVGVYVEFPVNGPTENMQLFEGKTGQNGIVNWINPTPLERKPVSASMVDLDFYPPGYEAKLNELKWKKGKQQRDSLYLSFEENDTTDSSTKNVDNFASLTEAEINMIFDYIDSQSSYDDGRPSGKQNHIPPSKVLAFWNPKFDNTILATKDFEKRMQAIHKTCNPLVLSMYLDNLNSELWKTDERVARMGYSEFSAFAAERVGKIDLTDAHQRNLEQFFDARLNEIRERAKNDRAFAQRLKEAYNKQLNGIRNDQSLKDAQRWKQNYQDEWELNYVDCLRQLGKKREKVGFTLRSGAPVYNLDRFVSEQTLTRSSGKFYDKGTGKTAEICYDPLSFEIENTDKYQKLFIYLLPDKLHSFERVPVSAGKASYNLNRLISYKAVVVGIGENGYFLKQLGKVSPGKIGNIALTKVSEAELDKVLNGLDANRIEMQAFGAAEIDWLRAEQKDFKVQRLRMEQAKFRNTLLPIVYPCTFDFQGFEYLPEH